MTLRESIISTKKSGLIPVIAEIKRLIPKLVAEKGQTRDLRRASWLAERYQEGGAAGISLVTERKYFGGQAEIDLPEVLRYTTLPVLIKDFILKPEDVDHYAELVSKVDAVFLPRVTLLLIAHQVKERLAYLLEKVSSSGMSTLIEARWPDDFKYLQEFANRITLIGINNKNIDELEKDEGWVSIEAGIVADIRAKIKNTLIISESAHHQLEDLRRSWAAGADAILVGTAFMLAEDPVAKVYSFVHALDFPEVKT